MSEEQNKAPNEGEARVLSDDELKGIVGGGVFVVEAESGPAVEEIPLEGSHVTVKPMVAQ